MKSRKYQAKYRSNQWNNTNNIIMLIHIYQWIFKMVSCEGISCDGIEKVFILCDLLTSIIILQTVLILFKRTRTFISMGLGRLLNSIEIAYWSKLDKQWKSRSIKTTISCNMGLIVSVDTLSKWRLHSEYLVSQWTLNIFITWLS